MAVASKENKTQIITEHKKHDTDTGSTEVQVALLTHRINYLAEHLQTHKKDFASRRGLLMLVGRRSTLLKYLARVDRTRYLELIRKLGIRK